MSLIDDGKKLVERVQEGVTFNVAGQPIQVKPGGEGVNASAEVGDSTINASVGVRSNSITGQLGVDIPVNGSNLNGNVNVRVGVNDNQTYARVGGKFSFGSPITPGDETVTVNRGRPLEEVMAELDQRQEAALARIGLGQAGANPPSNEQPASETPGTTAPQDNQESAPAPEAPVENKIAINPHVLRQRGGRG